jgi:hypothetical protein
VNGKIQIEGISIPSLEGRQAHCIKVFSKGVGFEKSLGKKFNKSFK